MQGPRKKTGGSAAQSIGEASARSAIKDPNASRMLRMGQSLGNDELKRRIESGNASRDELLAHLADRLSAMREAQMREKNAGMSHLESREAWMQIADAHKDDVTKPDPTRWHESAKLYEMAAFQLCRGALDRGGQLVEKAMEAERRAFEGVSSRINVKDLEPDSDEMAVLSDIKPNQACAPADMPEQVDQLAEAIQKEGTTFADPPVKPRKADPWWTLDEEEEEEGAPADGG